MYRFQATSYEGFLQQLSVSYVANGYFFYVAGRIPDHKTVERGDAKLITRYGINCSKWVRARRKRKGLANVQYLRYGRFFVLIATGGRHRFFEDEARAIKDIRQMPLRFGGYSVGCRLGRGRYHPSVRI